MGGLRPGPRALLVPGVVADDHPPHQDPADGLRADHPGRRHLRRCPLRPARPAGLRRHLHRGRALPRLRRHLRRRRGDLPRRQRSARSSSSSSPTRASTSTSTSTTTTTRSPRTPSPWSATAPPSASSTSSSSRRPTTSRTSRTTPRSPTRTPARRSRPTQLLDRHLQHRRVGRQGGAETTVTEIGKAFDGTGEDLGRIIDTCNSFIETANDNFDVTTALIRDSNTVLHGPARLGSAIRSFADDLALFSGTLAGSDRTCAGHRQRHRRPPPSCARSSRRTRSTSAELINNLVTTGEVVVKHLDGIEQILVLYPYVVEGGFTVVVQGPADRAATTPTSG